jgi:hypothetical protein
MRLSINFNGSSYRAKKVNDYVLRVDSDGFAFTYDFAARHMLLWYVGSLPTDRDTLWPARSRRARDHAGKADRTQRQSA